MQLRRTIGVFLCGLLGLAAGCARDVDGEKPAERSAASSAPAAEAPATLDRVDLASATATVGGASVPYRVALTNRTASPVPSLAIQGRIEQGSARRAAGGKVLSCGAAPGDLPLGTSAEDWEYHASNAGSGVGTLVAGPATLVVELRKDRLEVLQAYRLPITLQ